jgi:hypothetical protein
VGVVHIAAQILFGLKIQILVLQVALAMILAWVLVWEIVATQATINPLQLVVSKEIYGRNSLQ